MMNKPTVKVYLLGKDGLGWSIDQDRKNTFTLLNKIDKIKITHNPLSINVIYTIWYDIIRKPIIYYSIMLLKIITKVRVIAVITNDIRKTPWKIVKLKKIVNVWIAPNSKIYLFVKKIGLNVIMIPFLVDRSIFKPLRYSKSQICENLGIPIDKIDKYNLIGSFQRDSLGKDLSKPKWQKNPDLLIDIMRRLPKDEYKLILAGPRRHYIINKCKNFKIPYLFLGNEELIKEAKDDVFVNNLSLKKINLLYNLIDIYIVTSKSEGGPKAILEAPLTKTLVISTNVGISSDILHSSLIFNERNLDSAINMIDSLLKKPFLYKKMVEYNYSTVIAISNEEKIIRKLKQLLFSKTNS